MAVREFDGTDDKIRTNPGGLSSDSGIGNRTFVAIAKRLTDGGADRDAILGLNATSDVNAGLFFGDVSLHDCLGLFSDGASNLSRSTFTVKIADGWCLIAAGKASGTATPRFHKYRYSDATWTHSDGHASIGDGTLGTTQSCEIGSWFNGFDHCNMRMAVLGVFPGNLSDVNVETLELSLTAWLALSPTTCWPLNQTSTATAVEDIIGSADQTSLTGTTVVTGDDPPGFSFTLGAAPTPPQVIVGYRAQP